ncbi:TdiD protein, variant 2 [Coprinopsis cinerea AmutBmut pab1-1]|nr:TdiD protein, variant 2 [Coprinopsis cinerea AmutBmut pab1-1]
MANGVHTNGAQKQDRSNLIPFSSRLKEGRALAQDVWSIFAAANLPAECINLGQGYMNFAPPKWVTKAAEDALQDVAPNHYSHPRGRIRLREALKNFYSPLLNRDLDVESEILVTSGANEGQYSVFTAFLEQGDEVIMFEPFFDQYLPSVTFNGGKPVYVPLHPPTSSKLQSSSGEWTIDFDELKRAVTPRTKMIIVNTPHNPVGKVFTKEELEEIAAIAEENNLLVMSDEVYDSLVFDGKEHFRIATLPGMWDRTVTVGSAGSTCFSETPSDRSTLPLPQRLSPLLAGESAGFSVPRPSFNPHLPLPLALCSAQTPPCRRLPPAAWNKPRNESSLRHNWRNMLNDVRSYVMPLTDWA